MFSSADGTRNALNRGPERPTTAFVSHDSPIESTHRSPSCSPEPRNPGISPLRAPKTIVLSGAGGPAPQSLRPGQPGRGFECRTIRGFGCTPTRGFRCRPKIAPRQPSRGFRCSAIVFSSAGPIVVSGAGTFVVSDAAQIPQPCRGNRCSAERGIGCGQHVSSNAEPRGIEGAPSDQQLVLQAKFDLFLPLNSLTQLL